LKKAKPFSEQNVLIINKKIKEILELQEKNKGNNITNNKEQISNFNKIDIRKFTELQNKLNQLNEIASSRNLETSNENKVRENICSLQMQIIQKLDNEN
jgi:DNA-binding transcriptional MerR regulator